MDDPETAFWDGLSTAMARVAILTPEYPGVRPSFGGIAAQYAAIAPALAALGEEVHVFVVGAQAGPVGEQDGVVVHRVAVRRRTGPLFALARCIAARAALRGVPPFDTVVVADWSGNGSLLRQQDAPNLVTHLHTCLELFIRISGISTSGAARADFRTRLQLHLERRQARRSAAVLACSRAILEAAPRSWEIGSKPSAVLPNVVDPAAIRSLAQERSLSRVEGVGRPVLAAPGRLETRKGVGVLMRAMHDVWKEHPDATLVLCGAEGLVEGGPARAKLVELAGANASKVIFTGPLATRELFPTLADADVVVTPSLWEAFGIATLEAMALGKRIVATSGSGYEEFCKNGVNSILVAPNEAGELAGGVLRALASDAEALATAAGMTADEFSVARRAPDYRDWLQRMTDLTVSGEPVCQPS